MSPIRPENRCRYPEDWKDLRMRILDRAKECCEFCGVKNGAMVDRGEKMTKVVLTIAHLDHQPENSDPGNLRALCQKCHLGYDADEHRKNRAINRMRDRESAGQITLFEGAPDEA